MNNILYFASKYLKRTLEQKVTQNRVHQIWSWHEVFIKHGTLVPVFPPKYLKRTVEKSHMKSGLSNMFLVYWYKVFIKHDPIGPIFCF